MTNLVHKTTDAFCFLTILTVLSLAGGTFYITLLVIDAIIQGT